MHYKAVRDIATSQAPRTFAYSNELVEHVGKYRKATGIAALRQRTGLTIGRITITRP